MPEPDPIKILYMEDDAGLARLLQKRLERAGYRVTLACNGAEGLALYDAGQYDLVAVDQNMPIHDGLDVIRILASRGSLPPIIMVTGEGNEKIAAQALKMGARDYVVKDVNAGYLELLPSVIEQVLSQHRLIEEKRWAEAAQTRYAYQMAALYETSLEINSQSDLSALLQMIVRHAAGLLGLHVGGLYLTEPDGQTLKLVVNYNLVKDSTSIRLHFGEGLSGRVAQSGQMLMVEDYDHWDGRAAAYAKMLLGRMLGVPLRIGDRIIGVINVADDQETGPFSEDEIRLVTLFADQAAIAIENARLYASAQQELIERKRAEESLHRRIQELTALHAVATMAAVATNVDALVRDAVQMINWMVFPADEFGLGLVDNEAGVLRVRLLHDGAYQEHTIPFSQGITGNVVATGQPARVSEAAGDSRYLGLNPGMHSCLCVPLVAGEHVIGVMYAESIRPNAFNDADERLMLTFARQLATAIEKVRLFAEIERLAITDSLTGLYNRRHFFAVGEHELTRSRRYSHPLSAIMVDIDFFKQINDTYGHAIGDQVLRLVAEQCRKELRQTDIIGRYGGEEFVILLPETDLVDAQQIAERIRQSISQATLTTPRETITVTISAGVTLFDEKQSRLEDLLNCADRAMYQSKQAGRNRVSIWKRAAE